MNLAMHYIMHMDKFSFHIFVLFDLTWAPSKLRPDLYSTTFCEKDTQNQGTKSIRIGKGPLNERPIIDQAN